MTNKPKILVQTLSRCSCLNPSDLSKRILRFDKMLPEIRPSVYNWTDPINKPWDINNLEDLLPDIRGITYGKSVYWKRLSSPRAEGVFGVAPHNGKSDENDQHSNSRFTVNLGEINVDNLVEYLIENARDDADIAQIHVMTPQEKVSRELEFSFSGHFEEYTTFVLKHWLPELPWGVVFGEPYVQLFGMNRLLNAPAYKVQKISNNAVYIQLSPSLSDLITNYDVVNGVRQNIKNHIGRDVFFDVNKAYALELMGEIPASQWAKLHSEFKQPPPGSTGLRVPDFRFIKDDETVLVNRPKVQYQENKHDVIDKYDDASWHYGGNFPANLPMEASMTHMAMYWTWAVLSGLCASDKLRKKIEHEFKTRHASPCTCFSQLNGEKLTSAGLSKEGASFSKIYYEKNFYVDYANTVAKNIEIYEVPDSWETFSSLAPVLNIRFSEWKNAK